MTDAEFSNRLDRLIEAFENSLSNMGATINRTAGSLNTASASLRNTATAANFVQRAFESYTGAARTTVDVERMKIRVGEQLAQTLKTLGASSLRASESLYTTTSGLNSFTKTIDDVNQLFASLGPAINDSIFIGAISKASPLLAGLGLAAKSAGIIFKGFTALVSSQINLMQEQITSYYEVNRAGAIFGGTLTNMQIAAHQVGVSLPLLGKITVENIEDLSKFGLGLSHSATVIAEHASTTAKSDQALINLYGSTEELAKGTAAYIALQTQLGDTQAIDLKKNSAGINSFLLRQKELSDLTGLRAEQLKQEEQERRKNLAYTSKLGRLGDTARQNITEGMTVAGKIFGEEGASYAKEFFATGGRVVSRESLIFASMMPEAAAAIQAMVTNVDQSKEDYRKGVGAYLDANKDALQRFAQGLESFAEINFAANNPIITSMTTVGSRLMENASFIKLINDNFASIDEEARKRRQGLVVRPGEGPDAVAQTVLDTAAQVIARSEQIRLQNQVKMDESVSRNFGKMLGAIEVLGAIQRLQISITAAATGLVAGGTELLTDLVNGAIRLTKELTGLDGGTPESILRAQEAERERLRSIGILDPAAGSAPAAPATPAPAPAPAAPAPAPADGRPPLPAGMPVPVTQLDPVRSSGEINGSEVLAAMKQLPELIQAQTRINEESNRVLQDIRAVNERMLYSMS